MQYKFDDISLENLEKAEWISAPVINFCKSNHLIGLKDIISFYRKHGSFKNLKNCGETIERELSDKCNIFNNQSLDEIIEHILERSKIKKLVKNLTSNEIESANKYIEYLIIKLSVRARNGLLRLFNGTPSVIQFVDIVFSSTFSFRNIRNIGIKTVMELDEFTNSLLLFLTNFEFQGSETNSINNIENNAIPDLVSNYITIINEFNPFKRAALNRHIEYLISNLKIRARNGINQLIGETFTTKEIINKIYSHTFDFHDINNIGSKTVIELNAFKADISSFIETLRYIDDEHLSREYAKLIVKSTFSNLSINFNELFETVFDDTGKIKIFKLIYLLLENGYIFNQKEKLLFYYLYTENYSKTLEQIASEIGLGKERVRQLRVILENKAEDYFRFILSFNTQDLVKYSITEDTNFKIIDKELIQKINTAEAVFFNFLFYSKIFGLVFENSHCVLGDNEYISGKGNYSNTKRYKNCYLIEKSLFDAFSFARFINDVNENLSNRITQSYTLHFEGYLIQFFCKESKEHMSSIKKICEDILFAEFDLVVNNDGYLEFERNARKTLPEYTYEILNEIGEMSKIEDIVKAINNKYPELDITEQSIRSTLQREKELYIYIGRTSTYGLKKWELENKSIKGGTIRDLAEEFLEMHNKPQHIYDIINYIRQYRNTSGRNVFSNIQAEDKNRFVFFKGGYIGLKSKNYSPKDLTFKRVSGNNFKRDVLSKFNGWNYENLVKYYVNSFNYTAAQVKYLFETKIQNGEIVLNSDNTITI